MQLDARRQSSILVEDDQSACRPPAREELAQRVGWDRNLTMKKSFGITTPPALGAFRIPGQVPGRRQLEELTAMPSRRMKLVDTVHPCFSASRVVEGLGLSPDWEQYIAKAMTAANELVMRQEVFSKMYEERLGPDLRQVLFARSLSLWREQGRMSKSVIVRTAGELTKGAPFVGPRGGKWQDAKHTIPWVGKKKAPPTIDAIRDMLSAGSKPTRLVKMLSGPSFGMAKESAQKLVDKAVQEHQAQTVTKPLVIHGKPPSLLSSELRDRVVAGATKDQIRKILSALPTKTIHNIMRSLDVFRSPGKPAAREAQLVWDIASSVLRKKEPLTKAEARGGTYVRRVPKSGGGFTYFYDEDKYNAHSDAHVAGGEAAKAVITRTVAGHIKTAGKNGCELSTFKALVKRYGAEMVGGFLNDACAGGTLVYKNKRLFARGSVSSPSQEKVPSKKLGAKEELKSASSQKVKKGGFLFVEPLCKAGPYIGPRGGKWADSKHTVPWKKEATTKGKAQEIIPKPKKKGIGAYPYSVHGNFRRGDLVTDDAGAVYRIKTVGVGYHEDVSQRLYGATKAKAPKVWVATQQIRSTIEKILREGTQTPNSRGAYTQTAEGKWVNQGQEMPPVDRIHHWQDAKPGSLATFPSVAVYDGGYVMAVRPIYDDTPVVAWVHDPNLAAKLAVAMKDAPQPMHISRAEVRERKPPAPPTPKTEEETNPLRVEDQLDLFRALRFVFVDPLLKAGPHKYIRRTPKPGGGYNYYYTESAAAREAKAGEEIRLGEHTAKVVSVAESGAVTLELDGKRETVTADQWHDKLANHYGDSFLKGAERRAKQTINAVLRHVPRSMLEDLRGESDEARLEDLAKRLPAVYAKLQKAFSRAGMSPFAAKRSLSLVLERRGWEPEARAAAIGTVIQHREIGVRSLISASENLAGGDRVRAGHVAAAAELRAPGGKVGSFPEETAKLARSAEAELAVLSKMLSGAKRDPQMAATVLTQVMGSEAMQKLSMVAQAFPGLQDRAIEPVRKAVLAAGSVIPREKPTTEGAETIVYVAGEGGRPKALKARYRLVEANTVIPSHDPESFARHKDYPEGVQERAYHRDKAEQAKVIRNAQQMDARFIVNTNPDSVNGPPMVTADGIVLGGNSRVMSVQRLYKHHPEKAAEMRKYLEDHSHEVGLTSKDVQAMKSPVLIREVHVEDTSKANLQVLVRQMNESFTQGMDPRTMQVAMGRKLTDNTLQALADSMKEDETLAAFLASSRSERFVSSLFNAGIIDNRNVNQYMRKGTKTLNNDGRMLVSRILVGRTVDDADVLSDTGVQMLDSIAGSVPSMVQAASTGGKGFDLGEDLGVAVDAFNDLQRRVDAGVLPAIDPKMSAGALNRLYNYFDVLPGIGESHPVTGNKRAQILLEVLIRKRGPTQMAKVFRAYAKTAVANPEGQTVLFGAKTTPMEALKQATGIGDKKPTQPEFRLAASMVSRPLGKVRFVLGGSP